MTRLTPAPRLVAAAAALVTSAAVAQPAILTPPAAMRLDGVPPIAAAIVDKVAAYTEFKPSAVLDWHPQRREILIRQRLRNTAQLHRVVQPGQAPEPMTDLAEAVAGGTWQPKKGGYLLLSGSEGGNEVYRIRRFDPQTKALTAVSPDGQRAGSLNWSPDGERIVYTTVPVDRNNQSRELQTTVYLADPLKPEAARVLARLPGGGWFSFRFSPDGKQLSYIEYRSAESSDLWLMDVASGESRRLTQQAKGEPVAYRDAEFAPDGKGLYAISDRGSPFARLVYLDIASGKETPLAANLQADVESIAVSGEANRLAFITNDAGAHTLRFLDLKTRKEVDRPALVPGVVSGMLWRPDGGELAFAHASAKSPGDVFTYDPKANRVTRWTNGNSPKLNAQAFVDPRVIRWKSFDGREITGLYYHPPSSFEGPRPVYVSIHGGPEAQARAGFIGRNNYLVNELGVAVIYPNVRGSSGFGKEFLKLDNGRLREDSVKDIGALLEWIAKQPGLDAKRVLVTGGSYGGYMTFATAVHYADRIAGAASSVGISNFVTFLERTETYRRDLRRVEYGDERDPAMRAFLESISPLNQADRISKPLFVIQGKNDPRVPWTESEQIVAALKKRGTPVWYMLAEDEGHGFQKKANADYQFYALLAFVERTLFPR